MNQMLLHQELLQSGVDRREEDVKSFTRSRKAGRLAAMARIRRPGRSRKAAPTAVAKPVSPLTVAHRPR